jgi:WD40 repeat protein
MLTCSGDQSAHIWRPNLENVLERRREKGGGQSHENEGFCSNFATFLSTFQLPFLDDQFSQQIGQPLLKLTGHTDAIMDGNWLFGGEKIITVSWDRTANLYDAESGKVLKTLSGSRK